MDIKLPYSLIEEYLETDASVMSVVDLLTACGPTVDRVTPLGKDTILEIEIITNRVDSASAFGIAREAAAILPTFGQKAHVKNNPYQDLKYRFKSGGDLSLNVQIMDQSLVRRFAAVVLEDIKVGPSDEATVALLEKCGLRSVDNVVDISNELTLRLGQPVHIFDYDKLKGQKMVLRESRRGETVQTLDGREHKLLGKDIVIADGEGRLIDLCGVMGGELSKVDQTTRRVVLFVQSYEPTRVRKTSLYTQERTLAAQIFEKNPDPQLVMPTLNLGIELLSKRAGATVAGKLVDIYPTKPKSAALNLDLAWLNQVAGVDLERAEVVGILERLGFKARPSGKQKNTLNVIVPTWRVGEVTIKEDLAEEILRLYGYFKLPSTLPDTSVPFEQEPILKLETAIKRYLADVGFTESFNYSLVSANLMVKANLSVAEAPALSNPLSVDYTHLRTSLAPSLLETLALNKPIAPDALFFEISNVYLNWDGKGLPQESPQLVITGLNLDYRRLKGYLEALFDKLRVDTSNLNFVTKTHPFLSPAMEIKLGKIAVGHLGMVSTTVADNFGLASTPLTQLDLQALSPLTFGAFDYQPISTFPPILEEITIGSNKPVSDLLYLLRNSNTLLTKVDYLGSHQDNHSFGLTFQSQDRNLTKEEVGQIKRQLIALA